MVIIPFHLIEEGSKGDKMAHKNENKKTAGTSPAPVSKTESGRQYNELGGVKPNPDKPVPGATQKHPYTNAKTRPLPEAEYLTPGQLEGQKVLRKWLGKK